MSGKNRSQNFVEFTSSRPSAIDVDSAVITGVKILGYESQNGRTYDKAAVSRAKGLYEARSVYFDHATNPTASRSMGEKAGVIRNVVERSDGLYGDLHLLKSHPTAARVIEAAQTMPEAFGLSHNVDGRAIKRNGKVVVEEIYKVRSVDVVAEPATTGSLFESLNGDQPADADPAASGENFNECEPMKEAINEAVVAATQEMKAQIAVLTEQLETERIAKAAMEKQSACRLLLESCGVEVKPFMLHVMSLIDDDSVCKELAESWKQSRVSAPVRSAAGFSGGGSEYVAPRSGKELVSRCR